jgi:hypothetical protein
MYFKKSEGQESKIGLFWGWVPMGRGEGKRKG